MQPKKMAKRAPGSIALLDIMNDRQEKIHAINDLKGEVASIERRVKKQIIRDGEVDLLSVNWARLRRQVGR